MDTFFEFSALFHKELYLNPDRRIWVTYCLGVGGWGRGSDSTPKSDSKLWNFNFSVEKNYSSNVRLKVWKRDTDGKRVSSSLLNFWSPLNWRGRQKKKESMWVRVCWRGDSAPCLPGSQPLFQKKKITDTLLWTWEIQELGGTAHMTRLFWNSPWQLTCHIVTPAQKVRMAREKRTGHLWAGEGHRRMEEPFRAHNSGAERWGGNQGLSWSSDWVQMVQGGLCVWWWGWSEASSE